ncbi:MAG: aquaporin [Vicinamibacterales bacterium]
MTPGSSVAWRALSSEFVGTAMLATAVVGSGIMAEQLAGGNGAVALMANAVATGAALRVLIAVLGPLSGAHLNPVVSLAAAWWREIDASHAVARVVVQSLGAVAGVAVSHAMYALPLLQAGTIARTGPGIWLGEVLATSGLVTVIRLCPSALAGTAVSLYIVSAYWFTSSTSFANPALTMARGLTGTFTGIRPSDTIAFIAAQAVGAVAGVLLSTLLVRDEAGV